MSGSLVGPLAAGLCLLAGCGGSSAERSDGPDRQSRVAQPRVVDVATLTASEVPALVLRECHGEIRGMDRLAARLWLPDQTMLRLFAQLPDDIRVEFPNGDIQIVRQTDAVRIRRAADGPLETVPLASEAARRLRAVRALIDIATLGPLRRASACERIGTRSFRLLQSAGEPWEMVLREDSLLVERMVGHGYDARITEHLRTAVSWIVRALEIEPLGACVLRLDSVDFRFEDALFRPGQSNMNQAEQTDPATKPAHPLIRVNQELRPTTPEIHGTNELWWLVMEDPGDWSNRAQQVQEQLALLRDQGQVLAGFTGFITEDRKRRLVIGFRQQHEDNPPYEPPDGQDVRHVPAQRVLVVFPPAGTIEERIAEGTRQLREKLSASGLSSTGPILAQPYLHLDEGLPTAERIADPVVRVSVHIGK